MTGADALLAQARAGLRRLSPAEVVTACEHGALLVDIRTEAQRRRDQGPAHADTQGKGDVGALRRRGAREGRAGARCASGRRGRGSGPALGWAPGAGEVLDLGDQLGGGGRRAVTQPGPQLATDPPGEEQVLAPLLHLDPARRPVGRRPHEGGCGGGPSVDLGHGQLVGHQVSAVVPAGVVQPRDGAAHHHVGVLDLLRGAEHRARARVGGRGRPDEDEGEEQRHHEQGTLHAPRTGPVALRFRGRPLPHAQPTARHTKVCRPLG
jgi:hypothetical protein